MAAKERRGEEKKRGEERRGEERRGGGVVAIHINSGGEPLIVAIPDGQNFHQKLQALVIIKIQISIHQKEAHSELCQPITVGHCELQVTRVLIFPIQISVEQNQNLQVLEPNTFGQHDFSQRAANGTLFDVH